jgi:hypothetical protein
MKTIAEAKEFWINQLLNAKNDQDRVKIIEKLNKISLKAGEAQLNHVDVKEKVILCKTNDIPIADIPKADLSSLMAEKEKLVKIIQNFDDEDAKIDLLEVERQISQHQQNDPSRELRYYFSEKYQQQFVWDVSAAQIQFDDGIIYSIEEINEVHGYDNKTRDLIHLMKKKFNVKLIKNDKSYYLSMMKGVN